MKIKILCAVAVILFCACTRQFPTTPGVVSSEFYPLIQTSNTWAFGTTQRPGVVVPFEVQFASNSPIREINAYQVVNRTVGTTTTRDTTRFFTAPYQAAYSTLKQTDTLVITHTTPSVVRSTGTTVAVNIIAEVVTQSGLLRRRAFSAANGYVLSAP
jgi:hypothetical protein